MPEGDTIYRAARTLNTALAGRTVTRFATVLPQLARVDDDAPIAGRTIERVVSSGKNLIIDFSGDLHLHTHMRMNGSWHLYKPGEKWMRRRSDMRIVIETDAWVAVGFTIPVAAFHDERSLERQDDLRQIGPDLLAESFDADEALRRIRERADSEIADVLLNQRVVAGIGNEYKSEVLHLGRINPFVHVSSLSDEQIRELLRIARKLMLASVRPKNVYGRGGQRCRKCGTAIAFAKQGRDARSTYWCPRCQPL